MRRSELQTAAGESWPARGYVARTVLTFLDSLGWKRLYTIVRAAAPELFEQVFRAMLPPMPDLPDTAQVPSLTLIDRLLQLSGALIAAATPAETLQAALETALGVGAAWGRAELTYPSGAAVEVQLERPGAGALLGPAAQRELRAQVAQRRQAHFGDVAGQSAAFLPLDSPQGAAGSSSWLSSASAASATRSGHSSRRWLPSAASHWTAGQTAA